MEIATSTRFRRAAVNCGESLITPFTMSRHATRRTIGGSILPRIAGADGRCGACPAGVAGPNK